MPMYQGLIGQRIGFDWLLSLSQTVQPYYCLVCAATFRKVGYSYPNHIFLIRDLHVFKLIRKKLKIKKHSISKENVSN